MATIVGPTLERSQGLIWGDGVKDSALYFDGHTVKLDVVGRDAGSPALLIRALNPANAPTEVFRVDKDGTITFPGIFSVTGQFALPTQGPTGGLLIGGDALLYRSSANTLSTGAGDALNVSGAITAGGSILISTGNLAFSDAVSKIVPGATSFSIRSSGDAFDNLLVSNAGAVTVRAGLTISGGNLVLSAGGITVTGGNLNFGDAVSKIVPGATSISLRSSGDAFDNLLLTDAGAATIRGGLTVTAGGVTITAGGLTVTAGNIISKDSAAPIMTLEVGTESVNNSAAYRFKGNTGAWGNSAGMATILSTITQANPSALKSQLDVYTNQGDILVAALTLTDAGAVLLNGGGGVFVGDTANANMTVGLTLNQAAADNEILALKSSDVAHGVTGVTETDTYAALQKVTGADGGLQVTGVNEASGGPGPAIYLLAVTNNPDTAKTTAALGAFRVSGTTYSGTTPAAIGANGNIAVFQNNGTTRQILDGDGDSHQDVGTAWTNFDEYDDPALLTALSVGVSRDGDPIKERFGHFLAEQRDALARSRLVTFNDDGHHFVNMSRLTMALVGAVRQQADRIAGLEARLALAEGA